MRSPKPRSAFTLNELLAFLAWVTIFMVVVGRYGAMGFLWFAAFNIVFFICVHYLYRYSIENIAELDQIVCRECGENGLSFTGRKDGDFWVCQCGARYTLRGPTLYWVRSETDRLPVSRWAWFGNGRWIDLDSQDGG
ncbi:hypothetical protein [Rubripirellula tenax]|nr:hypothetical protein [Rubripirellula tenax]